MSLNILHHRTAYGSREHGRSYNTFPSAVITPEGEILVSFRQAQHDQGASHIDPASHAMLIRSRDGGETFEAALLHDEKYEGVQDPGIKRLSDGTLLVTFFTWSVQERAYTLDPDGPDSPWREAGEHHVARIVGLYSIRSRDGGHTWDERVRIGEGIRALRGTGVELPGGNFLVASYERTGQITIHRTCDKGQHWETLSTLASPDGLNETSLFRTRGGKLVALMRSRRWDREGSALYTTESLDDGRTWSAPEARPFFSPSPFEALQLRSGKVLITYGYRFAPFGIRAILLDGEFADWDQAEETVLREDGLGFDLGYTSAVQLPNDDILVFYYFYGEDGYRYIGVTTCRES